MKKMLIAAALLLAASAQAQVNVTVSIGQPNFYGPLDVVDYGPPQLIYAQPVIVQRPVHYVGRPIYLRVPPGHAKNWSRHCRAYNACNQEVYFVQDSWYRNHYVPRYRQYHPVRQDAHPHARPEHRPQPHGRPDRHNDRHEHNQRPDRDHGPRGNAHGQGHGNDRGQGHGNDRGHGRGNEHRN